MSISITDLSISYNKNPILTDISIEIPDGEFIGLVGKNGSGKSTLAHSIMGLIPQAIPGSITGDIVIDGIHESSSSIADRARKVGMVFQDPGMVIFNPTVREEVLFGVNNLGLDLPEERMRQAVQDVGLVGLEERDPQTLSEGQKQQLCIASVLAMGTNTLMLDEPIAHLDYENACLVYTLLQKLNIQGKTIIVIEHDTDFVFAYCSRTCVLHKGTIVMDGKTENVFRNAEKIQKYGVKPVRM
jgi:energy-coupling factor transporter ATP-binding protein EcfA2